MQTHDYQRATIIQHIDTERRNSDRYPSTSTKPKRFGCASTTAVLLVVAVALGDDDVAAPVDVALVVMRGDGTLINAGATAHTTPPTNRTT
jgi:hypothetical protein